MSSGQQPGSVCCACVCRLYWIHCLLPQQVCRAGLSRVPAQRGGQAAGSFILQTNKLQNAMATVLLSSSYVHDMICHTAIVRASLSCNPVSSSHSMQCSVIFSLLKAACHLILSPPLTDCLLPTASRQQGEGQHSIPSRHLHTRIRKGKPQKGAEVLWRSPTILLCWAVRQCLPSGSVTISIHRLGRVTQCSVASFFHAS